MSRSLCHYNDSLIAEGKREPGCNNCIANEIEDDPCKMIMDGYKWDGKTWKQNMKQ